jgi:hypothetical protein
MNTKIIIAAAVGTVSAVVVGGAICYKFCKKAKTPAAIPSTTAPAAPAPAKQYLAPFIKMMMDHNIPVDHNIDIGTTGYLDYPVKNRLFCGFDAQGRAFVNLPLKVAKRINGSDWTQYDAAVVLFQREASDHTLFVLGGDTSMILPDDFPGNDFSEGWTFDPLLALLEGKMLLNTKNNTTYEIILGKVG